MSFRNRYVIYGANGLISLTIPVAGGREQRTLIKEVLIDKSLNWKTEHWRGIHSSYAKAPLFEYYAEDVQKLLYSNQKFLFDFNINILEGLQNILKVNFNLGYTSIFKRQYEKEHDYRNFFMPKTYQSSCDMNLLYQQVFSNRWGFQPNLSILDLIFCEGPNSKSFLLPSVK